MNTVIKPISLTKIRSIAANLPLPTIAKLNQFIIQHVADSFGKSDLIVETYSQLQPQLYTTDIVHNTEWISTHLGLTKGQKASALEFIRIMYEAFHLDTICPDYVDHWKESGLVIEPYIDGEESLTFKQLIENTGKSQPGEYIGQDLPEGIARFLSNTFGRALLIPESTPTVIGNPVSNELDYLYSNDDIVGEEFRKLEKALSKGKLKKYANLMDEYGHSMQNFKREGKNVVAISNADTTDSHTDKWTELLNYKVNANNPIAEMQMLDKHYLENGVVYEAPLCFDKIMNKLMYQRANNLITSEEVKSQLNKFLHKLLGERLASLIYFEDNEEGFAMGISGKGFGAILAQQEITQRLKSTRILN